MESIPPPSAAPRLTDRGSQLRGRPRAVVLGDVALDVVLVPARPLERGSDVPGVVRVHQGGSAANTARWLSRLGVSTTLVCAVGRDGPGRALVAALRSDGVHVRVARPAGARTARIGMLIDEAGERSFVADRGAADLLATADLRSSWFAGASILHLPAYSLLGSPLGDAACRAIELARDAGAAVSVDLASAVPLLAGGRREAHQLIAGAGPDVLFTTMAEALAFLGAREPDGLLGFAPVAIVKRGSDGATILARGGGPAGYGRPGGGSAAVPAHVSAHAPVIRLDIATRPLSAADTTGAGDAFDAGFLAAWLAADRSTAPDILRRAVVAAHRAAARQVARPRPELALG